MSAPLVCIFGCAGTALTDHQRRLFREVKPLGFILLLRNSESPAQVRALIADMRHCVGRPDAPQTCTASGKTNPEAMRRLFKFKNAMPNLRRNYNAAPTQKLPVVRLVERGERELVALK